MNLANILLRKVFCWQITYFLCFSHLDLFCWKGKMSSQTTKSNITKMIADSVIDDFAAALVGGLSRGEGKPGRQPGRQGGRIGFFPSFCMTIWKLLYDWELYCEIVGVGGRKSCFSLCASYFNTCILIWEWDAETVWEKPGLRGKRRSQTIERACNFCMQPFSSHQCSFIPWLDHTGTEFIKTGWLLCLCGVASVSQRSNYASAASDVNLTVTCAVCSSAVHFVVFTENCSFCQCLLPSPSDYIHVQINKYKNK